MYKLKLYFSRSGNFNLPNQIIQGFKDFESLYSSSGVPPLFCHTIYDKARFINKAAFY